MGIQSASLNVMRAAAEKAGRALRRDFGEIEKLQVSPKGPGDFVTNADLKAKTLSVKSCKPRGPDTAF